MKTLKIYFVTASLLFAGYGIASATAKQAGTKEKAKAKSAAPAAKKDDKKNKDQGMAVKNQGMPNSGKSTNGAQQNQATPAK